MDQQEQNRVDEIPGEVWFELSAPEAGEPYTCQFLAFNTVITLQAYGEYSRIKKAFEQARDLCRTYERLFSRTLPHSDVARISAAQGQKVTVDPLTAELVQAALRYCEESWGCFDVTIGSASKLWNFHEGIIPEETELSQALSHVDWKTIQVGEEAGKPWVQLLDPKASLDLGGIAKGWIADKLTEHLIESGIKAFIVNLGGNVVVHGMKPDGSLWRVGLQDPRAAGQIVGAISLSEGSAVTSGTYERHFEKDGVTYHHILSPITGYPVDTDVAGVTVVTKKSVDAEGFSTTLLALGLERGKAFVQSRPEIRAAHFVKPDGQVESVYSQSVQN